MTKRISFIVHGQVQGVSFRYFTRKKATLYNVTGWVRNTPNGKVEGEAQGEDEGIQKLVRDLERGPTYARVVKLERVEMEVTDGETAFEVRH